ERLGHHRVEHRVRPGNVEGAANGAELELVAGESERRSAVTIARFARELGQDRHAGLENPALLGRFGPAFFDLLDDVVELIAEEAIDRRSRSAYLSTARMTAQQKTRNWALSCGLLPGSSRFSPVSLDIDQLLCLPDPFTPANGFSCSRHARPYFGAILVMSCM